MRTRNVISITIYLYVYGGNYGGASVAPAHWATPMKSFPSSRYFFNLQLDIVATYSRCVWEYFRVSTTEMLHRKFRGLVSLFSIECPNWNQIACLFSEWWHGPAHSLSDGSQKACPYFARVLKPTWRGLPSRQSSAWNSSGHSQSERLQGNSGDPQTPGAFSVQWQQFGQERRRLQNWE